MKIPYRIEQTNNKHSRAVYKDDTIVIRLAKNLSNTQRENHVQDLLKRMTKQVAHSIVNRTAIDPFRALLDGDNTCAITLANDMEYIYELIPSKRTKVVQTSNGWKINIGPDVRKEKLHRLLWKTLSNEYKDILSDYIHQINEQTLQVKIRDIRIRYAKSQWGSCSSRGDIMLNTALLFVPQEQLEYVVVHELAHRIKQDHSATYWAVVEKHMPDYEKKRKVLKGFRLLGI